jgi:hypothetical protein
MIIRVRHRFTGLWLHANFRKLWAGQSASLLGSQIAGIAVPLAAILVLDATAMQMGILAAMGGVPALIGIYLGVWVDRRRRAPIVVGADIGRAVLLGLVPVAYLFDFLTMNLLYAVAVGIGGLSMLFQIAYRSFLPSVVIRSQLVDANSKLELATAGTASVGPGAGGLLTQVLAAPIAVAFGSLMYVFSAILFRSMRVVEVIAPSRNDSSGKSISAFASIKEGFGFLRRNPVLIGIALSEATLVIFGAAWEAISLLFMVRELDFSPGMIGALASIGSVGLFAGSYISPRLSKKIGVGPSIGIALIVMSLSGFVLPLAGGPTAAIYALVAVSEVAFLVGLVIYQVLQVSVRQSMTPDSLQGRITSIMVVSSRAAAPLGAIIGGLVGQQVGLRESLLISSAGMGAAVFWLLYYRTWSLREMPGLGDA